MRHVNITLNGTSLNGILYFAAHWALNKYSTGSLIQLKIFIGQRVVLAYCYLGPQINAIAYKEETLLMFPAVMGICILYTLKFISPKTILMG